MVHAIHSSSIVEGDQSVYAGEACGYVLEFEGGARVYHAGDTGVFGDMKLIGELYRPSIAVLPIHHGTFPGLPGTPATLRAELSDRPDIEVVALKPGESAS